MSVQNEIVERDITEVLHFTTNRGLVGILATRHLRSRRRLPEDEYLQHILHPNAIVRPEDKPYFDKSKDWLDYVNLSISEINSSFFGFSGTWTHNQGRWWAILAFDPVILTHDGVFFATTNNAYEHCNRKDGLKGLLQLFAPTVWRKGQWRAVRGNRQPRLPTCEQAEALYPGEVSTEFLRRIYVRNGEDADRAGGFLRDFPHPGVEVLVDERKFAGARN